MSFTTLAYMSGVATFLGAFLMGFFAPHPWGLVLVGACIFIWGVMPIRRL